MMMTATCVDDQVLNQQKKKEKRKSYGAQGKGINRDFISVIKTL
jgi:hypothetical protein